MKHCNKFLEYSNLRVCQGQEVCQEFQVSREKEEQLVPSVQRVHLAELAREATKVQWVPQVRQENQARRVSLAVPDLKERQVHLAHPEREEQLALKACRYTKISQNNVTMGYW